MIRATVTQPAYFTVGHKVELQCKMRISPFPADKIMMQLSELGNKHDIVISWLVKGTIIISVVGDNKTQAYTALKLFLRRVGEQLYFIITYI